MLKRRKKIIRAESMDDTKEIVYSRHNRNGTSMNSQRLWQHVQGLHRFNSDMVLVLRGARGEDLSYLTKKLSLIDNHLQRKVNLPQ